jgi:predicted lipoprotein with Yx(FWY)xxD motif
MLAFAQLNRHAKRSWRLGGALATASVVALSACGSSSATKTADTTAGSGPAGSGSPPAGVTISAADVPGIGSVLVNGDGRTLYLLSSEAGGKLTCTDDNGCTKVWPDTELPAGVTQATAGSGVQASLLGTVKGAGGNLYVTYGGYPVYQFSGDKGPGTVNGQGITSFGGTWSAMTPAGTAAANPGVGITVPAGYGGY